MKRICLALAATLAAVFGWPAAQAVPSTSHVVTQIGSVTTGSVTIAGLSASEAAQTGTATVNGLPLAITCVSVMVSGPGLHLAGLSGVDTSGTAWYILLRQPTPATALVLASNNPAASPWCNAGDWPFSTPPATGTFLITP